MTSINPALAAIAFETIFDNLNAAKISVYGKMQVKFRHLPFTVSGFLEAIKDSEGLSPFQKKLNRIAENYFWDEVSKKLPVEDCEVFLKELNNEAWEQYQEGLLCKLDVVNLTLDALALKMKEEPKQFIIM